MDDKDSVDKGILTPEQIVKLQKLAKEFEEKQEEFRDILRRTFVRDPEVLKIIIDI